MELLQTCTIIIIPAFAEIVNVRAARGQGCCKLGLGSVIASIPLRYRMLHKTAGGGIRSQATVAILLITWWRDRSPVLRAGARVVAWLLIGNERCLESKG
jgi:hypothetical protein